MIDSEIRNNHGIKLLEIRVIINYYYFISYNFFNNI